MKKSFFKRGASALLAVVMCLSTFLGIGSTTAFAAENTTDEVVMFSFPREGDSNFGGDWGHGELKYMNGWSAASTKKITVYTIGSWTGNACYCIEPGTPLNIGDVMTKRDENYWDNYLGANEYEILSFDDDRVMLYDLQFPLFNKEMTRAEFDQKVQENPMNDHLKVKVEATITEPNAVNESETKTLYAVLSALKIDDVELNYKNMIP